MLPIAESNAATNGSAQLTENIFQCLGTSPPSHGWTLASTSAERAASAAKRAASTTLASAVCCRYLHLCS